MLHNRLKTISNAEYFGKYFNFKEIHTLKKNRNNNAILFRVGSIVIM